MTSPTASVRARSKLHAALRYGNGHIRRFPAPVSVQCQSTDIALRARSPGKAVKRYGVALKASVLMEVGDWTRIAPAAFATVGAQGVSVLRKDMAVPNRPKG